MGTKYNPKEELLVLMAIQELGESSIDEIREYIENHWQNLTESEPKEVPKSKVLRYVRRWNKRKAVSSNIVNSELVYSLADIPWYPRNQIIRVLKTPDETEASAFIDAYESKLKGRKSIRLPQSVYRDYAKFVLTFEVIDSIAGGIPNGERKLQFPKRDNGDLYIPINWLKGWTRDNSVLANLPQTVFKKRTGFSTGEFVEQPETHKIMKKVLMGLTEYEYIKTGERFKVKMNYPMHGTIIKTKEGLAEFFHSLEDTPIRGLGANPAAFGGRVKLLEMRELN